jgi:hydrophobe/amphiphile efflux-1 (HAE1) family protein
MNFSAPFVRRPIATTLLTIAVALLGVIAYAHLPIASLPLLERPTITVFASLPGASSDTIASSVSSPLERQLGLISGLKEMRASSVLGKCTIVLEFGLDKDLDEAAEAVQSAIIAAEAWLPKNLPQPPTYAKANANGFPIIALALTSDAYDAPAIFDYADTVLAQKLSQIDGIAAIFIGGSARPAVRIQVNPRAVADMNLSLEAVRSAVSTATEDLPTGQISNGPHTISLALNDQLYKASDYKDIIVATNNTGAPVKLGDVSNVTDSTVNVDRAGWYNGKRAILMYVIKQPDANVVKTVDDIRAALPQLQRWIPAAIKLEVIYDRTLLIRAAVADVQFTMAIALVLVVLVMALFLRRFWATIIPVVTIPIAIAATLVVMYFLDFSLDNISLMALTIAIGFVIDDAVIIIENIARLIQEGERPIDAALRGTRQMGFTVASMTLALIASLIPVLFMPDIVGRLFREFGVTLVAAISASAIVSLTLTPMLCGQLLGRGERIESGRIGQFFARAIDRVLAWYSTSLDWSLRFRWVTLLLALALATATTAVYVNIPKGFLPTQDTGILRVRTVTRSSTSFTAMTDLQQTAAAAVAADPAVESVASSVGRGVVSVGAMLINLKPLEVRKQSIEQVIERLRASLAKVHGIRTFFVPAQDIQIGASSGLARYQYALTGLDKDEVVHWARIMLRHVQQLPQTADAIWNYDTAGIEAGLFVNRTRAARAGVSVADLDNILYDWLGQRQIKTIRMPIVFHRVVLEVEPRFRQDPKDLTQLLFEQGVPSDAITSRRREHTPMWITHISQLPGIVIGFNTPLGVSISQAQAAIKQAEIDVGLPPGIRTEFRGEARQAQETRSAEPFLFLAAIIAVYVILGMLYESYAHPFTILSTLPSATFGAVAALMLTRTQFTLITAIACILLVGIVMKNAIMMVDFALDSERRLGLPPQAAIRRAAALRFRPIVMTTMAALGGSLPLALGTGAGSELRQPLGIAIVGGLLLSQFVTLYTTPAVYLAVGDLSMRLRRLRAGTVHPAPAADV